VIFNIWTIAEMLVVKLRPFLRPRGNCGEYRSYKTHPLLRKWDHSMGKMKGWRGEKEIIGNRGKESSGERREDVYLVFIYMIDGP
jgi:hypothetical protein